MKQLFDHTPAIRKALETFLQEQIAEADRTTRWQADSLERLLPYAAAGKLLRGSLVCFGYEAFAGKRASSSILQTAVAVELMHSALLIHDDIMDKDALRRGSPSMHEQYRSLADELHLIHPEHLGMSMAMNTGDSALFLAFGLLGTLKAEADRKSRTVSLFAEQVRLTCAGQMQDLYFEARREEPGRQELYDLMATKTAAYTIALPLMMGATLAGASDKAVSQLKGYGTKTGMIFQIRDDELGTMGASETTGKPVGSDIRSGKRTLIRHYLLQRSTPAERTRLHAIFGNPDASLEDISYVQGLIRTHGIGELLAADIARLQDEAGTILDLITLPAPARDELYRLIEFCSRRHA